MRVEIMTGQWTLSQIRRWYVNFICFHKFVLSFCRVSGAIVMGSRIWFVEFIAP